MTNTGSMKTSLRFVLITSTSKVVINAKGLYWSMSDLILSSDWSVIFEQCYNWQKTVSNDLQMALPDASDCRFLNYYFRN